MPLPYSPDSPDGEEIVLSVRDASVHLTRWTSYEVASDFLTPTDGWHFAIGDEELAERQRHALRLGAPIRLSVNATPICDGHIDTVEVGASKAGGTTWTIAGRDRLGPAVDATADPNLRFKDGATLADVLTTIFRPFGWSDPDKHFEIDNAANRRASTGGTRGQKRSHGKKTFGAVTKDAKLHQLQPHNHEGLFAFASRVSQRFGLWIWSSSDGEQLIVGKPDFDQEPLYQLRRKRDGTGNIEDGTVRYDFTDQPAIIVADGFSGGGEFGKGRVKAYAINPSFGFDTNGAVLEEVLSIVKRYPNAKRIALPTQAFQRRAANVPVRPMFMHDDESKTPEELENYVRREMALLTRKSLEATYTVEGHGQMTNGDFVVWDIDTVVDVQDEVAGLNERMYVLGVAYSKSRQSGTRTRLHLVRLNSIQF